MKLKKKKYTWSKRREITFLSFLFWTLVIVLSFFWNTYQAEEQVLLLADKEAKVNLERDLAFRRWATSHGGLYVPVSEKAKPNPHLQVDERDVKTPSGKMLTLNNPATMLREIKKSQEELSGVVTRITALQILNPVNAPDEWEKKALRIIQETKSDYTEQTLINGKPYLRKMQPMFMEDGCMKCHAWTGLKVGEIRGATDYSVPLEPYYKIFQESKIKMFFSHIGIWMFGLGIIFYLAKRSRKLEVELEESDRTIISISRAITKIVDNSPVGILLYEADTGKCIIANQAVANIVGGKIDDLLQQNFLSIDSWKKSGLLEVAQKTLKTKENSKGEFNFTTTFGKNIWVECVFSSFESQNISHLLLIMADISERKKAELELRKLLTAIEQSPTSIVISDIEANILYANPKFSEITGYTVEDILGKNPKLLHSGFTPQSVYDDLWHALTQGKNWSGEFVNKRKNGEIFHEQAFIAPVKDMEGKISYYVAVKLDITERKKMELALIKSKEEAEKANKAKSDFLATMSHEIRTPIHGILGLNEILLDSNPRIDQIPQLKTIAESGQNLLDIINNILNIAELEKNYIPLIISDFSLKNFLNETCNYYRLKLKQNNIFLICEFSDDLVDLISTDKRRLEQIIRNLIENAIKFTEEGTIVVYVKSELVAGDEHRLTFSIADTGKGISDDYKKKIFALFSQEDMSATRKYGGIGLGLAICKKLISRLGGEIFVESKLNKGSKFTFTILCKLAETPKTEVVSSSKSVSFSQLKILIVEDDVINMMIIQQQLRSLGCMQIETALDGKIALSKIKSADFDLVLTDLHMPNMDGFELAESIKKSPNGNPKIIAITADAYEETRQRCYSLGMANFLTKPFSKDQLEKTIKDILLN